MSQPVGGKKLLNRTACMIAASILWTLAVALLVIGTVDAILTTETSTSRALMVWGLFTTALAAVATIHVMCVGQTERIEKAIAMTQEYRESVSRIGSSR